MKTKFSGILTLLLAFVVQVTFAQEKTISGIVTDDLGPLPGVSVVIKGSTAGTQTDFDGNYTIQANVGDILQFSFVGMTSQEVTVGISNTIDVVLVADNVLDEVIVTAQGIKREKKALGYAVTQVNSEQLEQRSEGDVARVLNGKSAGVSIIQQSGLSGSGTNITIRGQNSFSSSNQALFIVDGVPFATDTNSQGRGGDRNDFVNGNNGSSRFLDLDPNSIESISVLKGLAASTLYGSDGRNGVILVTTKAGASGNVKKKTEITVTSSYFFNEIASLPDYQNEYGNGFDQNFGWFFSNWGPAFREEGAAGWGNQNAINGTVSGTPGFLRHPFSTAGASTTIPAAFPEFANALYEWKPYNSVDDFFNVGGVSNVSLNIRGASKDGDVSYNVNYGYLDDQGFTPGNKLRRNTLGIGGRAKLSNKFTVSGVMNFSLTDFTSPPVALSQGNGSTGTGSSIFGHLWFTPRSIDVLGIPFQSPIDGRSVYYRQNNSIQHPLWTLNNSATEQETNRVFGNASIQYAFNDNLNLIYRAGIDVYNENNINFQNRGGITGFVRSDNGFYETWNNKNTIWDHNVSLSGNYDITENIGATFNLGATTRRQVFDQTGVSSDNQQVFGVLRHFNFLNQNEIQSFFERNVVGLYAQGEFDYKNFLFLTVAGRNDWVSNFSKDNRSVFYPSASVSFLPTTVFPDMKSENGINYLKLRAGYGTSANFGDLGYPIANTLFLDTQDSQDSGGNNVVSNTTGAVLGNPDLKPELLTEVEVGIEGRFLKNRITLDLSAYLRTTKDLIINRPLDPSTGFSSTRTNIGEIENKGLEVDLGITFVKSEDADGFNWNTNVNFTTYESEVKDLGLDTDLVIYSGFSNLGNAAIKGQPLGVLFGSRALRDASGNAIIGSDGFYQTDPEDGIIGDPNPDWVANLRNSISYKNFTFSFQWNYTSGGDVYSSTIATLLGRGLAQETVNREDTYIIPGVTAAGGPNTVQINNSDFFFSNVLFGPSEFQVYDATVIRLQEISLAYALPKKFLDKTPFGSLVFTASGNNLWYDAINTPNSPNFDPNTSGTGVGNGFGFDFINGPSSKRYGLSLKATF
jgi:TonB-linked SusC/RagA family outer membrane protein